MYGSADGFEREFSSSAEAVNSGDEKSSLDGGRITTRHRERVWTTALASLVVSVPAVLVGYTIGFPSSALLDLTGDLAPGIPGGFGFSSALSATFAALASVGAALGGLIAGPISDRWGRKNALLLCSIPYFIGYLILSYAQYIPDVTGFKTLVLTGRFLTGIGIGWTLMSSTVYVIEISSTKLRGVFGSFVQIALSAGILLNYSIGSIPNFPYYNNSLVAAGIIALFVVAMVMMYETPRWLVANGNISEAYQSLAWLRGPDYDIDAEIRENMVAQSTPTNNFWSTMKEFRKRSVLVPLILVLFVVFFQQAGGLNAIDSYAASLFQTAGVSNPKVTATYAIGSTQLATTLMVVFVIDLVGRKVLLIISGSAMAVGTLLLGVQFYLTRPSLCNQSSNSTISQFHLEDSEPQVCNTQYGPLAVVSIMVYIVGFSIAWGPVPWILVSELTPLRVRGVASGVATLINWGTAAVVVGVYPPYSEAVRPWFAWWTFTLLNIGAVVFSVFFLRETKGKSLEEIENYYTTHIL